MIDRTHLKYNKRYMNQCNGFTLLELLIAMSIFAVLSVLAYGGMHMMLDAQDHSVKEAKRLTELQKAITIITRDIEQIVQRPVRNEFGEPLPAFLANDYNEMQLEFTRAGLANPLKQSRSTLQRVAYQVSEKQLLRISWPMLDRAEHTSTDELALIGRVIALNIRLLDHNQQWQSVWPFLDGPAQDQHGLPRALEVTLELEDWGRIRRLIPLASS